jgi:hypothetical protein
LPWAGLDQISIRFDSDVQVKVGDLDIRGVNVDHYDPANFFYDSDTHTATWTLDRPVRADKLLLDLNGGPGGVRDAATGVLLDGEWTSGTSSFPSGNGVSGGDLRFRLNVLAGDVDSNGVVNSVDLLQERQRRLRGIEDPGTGRSGYDVLYDVDADGRVTDADLLIVRSNVPMALPRGEPEGRSAAALSPTAPSGASAPVPVLGAVSAARRKRAEEAHLYGLFSAILV